MFTTARTQLIQQIVKPALAAEQTVVLDRYLLSTVVYQGHAGDLDPDELRTINRIATENCMPDLTFILDLPVDVAMPRLGSSLDRMESRGADYMQQVRDGYLLEANRFPQAIAVIDANREIEDIQTDIRKQAERMMNQKKG